jgi:hypothetical protein
MSRQNVNACFRQISSAFRLWNLPLLALVSLSGVASRARSTKVLDPEKREDNLSPRVVRFPLPKSHVDNEILPIANIRHHSIHAQSPLMKSRETNSTQKSQVKNAKRLMQKHRINLSNYQECTARCF